ncbi:MAG: DUF2062 domain-containing protein [Deltaproteobacteria bacterium]|nr:DUF2062 domain-containing protein [Deltaproteobacteria bacterium]
MTDTANTKERTENKGLLRRGVARLVAVLRQKDTPHRIALGMAMGIFVGLLPIMGVQMAVVAMLALPFRGNLKAAIAGVWISNPITFIPMYWGYYQFGLLFSSTKEIEWERFQGIISEAAEWSWMSVSQSMNRVVDIGVDILIPMWIGSTILAVVFGILTYFVAFRFVVKYRALRAAKK